MGTDIGNRIYSSKAVTQPGSPYAFTQEVMNCLWDLKTVFPEVLSRDQTHSGFNDELWFNLSIKDGFHIGRYCAVTRNLIDGSYEIQLLFRDIDGDCEYEEGYTSKISGLRCRGTDALMVAELLKSEALAQQSKLAVSGI